MLKEILINPNKILRQKTEEVIDFKNPEIKKIIQDLKDTLKSCKEGLGLAAPQIGYSWRIFALDLDEKIEIFINPEITHHSNKKSLFEEGCLSVPGKTGITERSNKVIMKSYDEKGNKKKITAKGLLAEAFQHEIDHLNGVLYIDKVK